MTTVIIIIVDSAAAEARVKRIHRPHIKAHRFEVLSNQLPKFLAKLFSLRVVVRFRAVVKYKPKALRTSSSEVVLLLGQKQLGTLFRRRILGSDI